MHLCAPIPIFGSQWDISEMKNVRPGPHPSVGCRGVRLTMLQGPSGHQVSTWKPKRASGRMPIRSTPQRGGLLLGFNPCGAGRASKGARPVERDAGGPRSPMRFAIAQPPWNLPDIPPDLVADGFAPILRRGHDAVPAHPLRARRPVGPPGHMPPPPLCIRISRGPGNRERPAEGRLCKAGCHPPA